MKSTQRFSVGANRVHDGRQQVFGQAVFPQDFGDLGDFLFGHFVGFSFLPDSLGFEVFGVGSSGQVAAQSHRDRPGSDFGQARRDDDSARRHGARQARCESKRNGEAVRHADHDVADGRRGGEVFLDVDSLRHQWLAFAGFIRHVGSQFSLRPQHFLNFLVLPQGHGSFRPARVFLAS